MRLTYKSSLVCLMVLALGAGSVAALVQDRPDSRLAARQFIAPELHLVPELAKVDDLPAAVRTDSLLALQNLGVDRSAGLLDKRGGGWGTLYPVIPMIPGDGFGNTLTWDNLGVAAPAGDDALRDIAWSRLVDYLGERSASLRLDPAEISVRSGVHDGGALVQFSGSRVFRGIPVRNAVFNAVLSHGNLALMGVHGWGDIDIDLTPALSADDAAVAVGRFLAPLTVERLAEASTLAIVPTMVTKGYAIGQGYGHRLVWVVRPEVTAENGTWEALVDAHDGRVVSFQDLNHYGTDRNINGGVYPVTYDGIGPEGTMQDNFPMPFADVTVGGPFTDAGGNFSGVGSATTTLDGQFVLIDDQCTGSFSESSTGDIELGGTQGDVNCDTPTSGDNTASARAGFYELNRIKELARGQLPSNTWLMGQLEANMNINLTCNAFWSGGSQTVNFYREGGGCGNTGQIASVFDHEWGHGMDDNDVQGSIISITNGGGEGIADAYGALRLNESCVGRYFRLNTLCPGYGDACTPASGCTGVRTVDYAERVSGLPHTLTWVQSNCSFSSPHCPSFPTSETIWDLLKRDMPTTYGMDNNTALEVVTRLTYIAGGNLSGWYPAIGGTPHNNCSASFGYNQFLVTDDDDGNLANGTPHMTAIAAAFSRLEIDCSPANGGPTVQDSGCSPNPTTAPTLSAAVGDTTATLSWNTVPNAASYNLYRTDGVFGCDFGKARITSTAGTGFGDTGLKNGHPYSYVVIPIGAGGASCFGPASNCASIGPGDIFADGFESGDTSAWDTTIPTP